MLGLLPRSARVTRLGPLPGQGADRTVGKGSREGPQQHDCLHPAGPADLAQPRLHRGPAGGRDHLDPRHVDKEEAHKKALELLELVGIPNAARRIDDFPHEFSGGQRQRIVIAIAMANDPDVMIADEPTNRPGRDYPGPGARRAARRPRQDRRSLLLINPTTWGSSAGMADRVMVMYAGKAVEAATADVLFHESKMPYTLGLLGSLPADGHVVRAKPLLADPGQPAVADSTFRTPVRSRRAGRRGHPALPRGGTGAEPRRAGAARVARMHAASCPGSTRFSAGSSSRQRRDDRGGKRGANGQASGRLISDGGLPGIGRSGSRDDVSIRAATRAGRAVRHLASWNRTSAVAALDCLSRVTDHHPVCHPCDDPQVVGDEQQRRRRSCRGRRAARRAPGPG